MIKMIEIFFEVILALFAAIGLACVCVEIVKIFGLGRKFGRAEMTVWFDEKADKRALVEEIFSDGRLECIIKVPAESLSDFDRAELEHYIENGKIVLF